MERRDTWSWEEKNCDIVSPRVIYSAHLAAIRRFRFAFITEGLGIGEAEMRRVAVAAACKDEGNGNTPRKSAGQLKWPLSLANSSCTRQQNGLTSKPHDWTPFASHCLVTSRQSAGEPTGKILESKLVGILSPKSNHTINLDANGGECITESPSLQILWKIYTFAYNVRGHEKMLIVVHVLLIVVHVVLIVVHVGLIEANVMLIMVLIVMHVVLILVHVELILIVLCVVLIVVLMVLIGVNVVLIVAACKAYGGTCDADCSCMEPVLLILLCLFTASLWFTMISRRSKIISESGLFDTLINNLLFELHIPGYKFCRSGTKLAKRLARWDRQHDIAYSQHKDPETQQQSDKILAQKADDIRKSSDTSVWHFQHHEGQSLDEHGCKEQEEGASETKSGVKGKKHMQCLVP
ncbi:hypothetical protein PR048_020306 [Dryococelus australis]|uniref:Uncharacterized protein n=1 Tax=Dryococelus australis TaxID=614101 RepID=A0ABQ9H6A9_9NEOP|nr:hypothetical protein PR048_020306 [Dryococelus australis]